MQKIIELDRKFKIMKKTSVMLMPRINKFKCGTIEDLVKALQIEKVYDRFVEDMRKLFDNEWDITFSYWLFEEFMADVWKLVEADFLGTGQQSETVVKNRLTQAGWEVQAYKDSTAYSNEARSIDIVAFKDGQTIHVSVKSAGFFNSPTDFVIAQLQKMVDNKCFLFIVKGTEILRYYKIWQVKQLLEDYKNLLKI